MNLNPATSNLATMNRRERRAKGSPWRWDRTITGEAGVRASRYERRNLAVEDMRAGTPGESGGSFSHPKTRRDRKRNARVRRVLARS